MVRLPGLSPARSVQQMTDGTWNVLVVPPMFVGSSGVTVHLTKDQFERFMKWEQGEGLIQDLLPDLTPSQREALMTGLSDEEFEAACKDEGPGY